MVIYSHSRLSTFEQCPFKFKLRYIDKIKPEVEKSIEAHLGTAVHDTLEWLYNEKKLGKVYPVDKVIEYYGEAWQKDFSEDIKIVRKNMTPKDYFNKGVTFLVDYYMKNHPFDDGTLELEKRIIIDLDGTGKYKLQGFIDRLVFNKFTGEYEVHDYKTANTLPTQEKMDEDRQLALYSIAIKELFGQQHNVLLTWHFLAHNIKICSRRTQEQLSQLKKDIIKLIDKIESTTEFPTKKSILCDWCEFKSMCPCFGEVIGKRQTCDNKYRLSNDRVGIVGERQNKLGFETDAPKLEEKDKRNYPTIGKYIKN